MMAFIWLVVVTTAILRCSSDNRDLMSFSSTQTTVPGFYRHSHSYVTVNTTCSSLYSLQVQSHKHDPIRYKHQSSFRIVVTLLHWARWMSIIFGHCMGTSKAVRQNLEQKAWVRG